MGALLEPSEEKTPALDLKKELDFRSRHRIGLAGQGHGIKGHNVWGGRKSASRASSRWEN